MKTIEFIQEIERALRLDAQEAEQTLRVVLAALSDRLPHDEAHALASQLPGPLKPVVEHLGRASLAGEPFADRVATDLGIDRREATKRTRAVYALLERSISPGESWKMKQRLPDEVLEVIRAS
jgi:uncharacterized protein (DUF2267 family)